jgi:hypothetical protein
MRSALTILAVSSVIALTTAQSWPSAAPAPGQSVRVSGTQDPATKNGDLWKSGRLATEAPLPSGYNAPTPDGAIEVKTYPTVRRAQVDSTDIFMSWAFGQSRAFWTLFNHIKNRNIAMTAPVEFDFRGADNTRKFLGNAEWTMSFLYRTPELGPTGDAGNSVKVVDRPEITVLSVGFEGEFTSYKVLNNAVDRLRQALKGQSTWVEAGEPRFFGYNSPMVKNKWAEVQLPIRLASN